MRIYSSVASYLAAFVMADIISRFAIGVDAQQRHGDWYFASIDGCHRELAQWYSWTFLALALFRWLARSGITKFVPASGMYDPLGQCDMALTAPYGTHTL